MKGEDTLAIKLNVSNKKIDVYPLANLLRQGENNADAIEVQLPERYGEIDLSSLTYIMYGDSEIGTRASQELEKEVNDEGLLLRWKISRDFTAVAGALNLLLEGYLADGELIIKWIGGAIDVYSDPAGGRYPPPKSEIEKALSKMYAVVGRAEQSAESAKLSARQADESEKNAQKHAENAQLSAENARMSALKSEQTAKAIEGEAQKVADTAQAGITAIADAGAAQVAAVQTEGTKKVEEIKKIESLLPAPSAQDAGKVPMVNPDGTGYELGSVAVDAYTKTESDARYMPLIAAIRPTVSGELIALTDSADFALQGLKIYGKSTQDGEPTPENPIPIVSVGEGGSINLTISDTAEQKQIFPIPTPDGLLGIPVKRGGNYTDSKRQQWACDEIDFARGKWVQRIRKVKLSDLSWKMQITQNNKNQNFIGSVRPHDAIEKNIPCICTILPFKDVSWDGEPSILPKAYCWGYNATVSFPPDSPINSLEIFQSLISETSAEIIYLLATPIEHDLTPELLAKFEQLHTYYSTTNLFASDNAGVEIQYLADTKLYIDNKLQSLVSQYHANQAAVLSLMPLETQATMIQNDTNNILSQEGLNE